MLWKQEATRWLRRCGWLVGTAATRCSQTVADLNLVRFRISSMQSTLSDGGGGTHLSRTRTAAWALLGDGNIRRGPPAPAAKAVKMVDLVQPRMRRCCLRGIGTRMHAPLAAGHQLLYMAANMLVIPQVQRIMPPWDCNRHGRLQLRPQQLTLAMCPHAGEWAGWQKRYPAPLWLLVASKWGPAWHLVWRVQSLQSGKEQVRTAAKDCGMATNSELRHSLLHVPRT
mmetsp:Transcript_109968/g.218424  ORF Transcript_109968/g.218424 Transcript_109968/m.218424 type:complete len:226 (-) Transcript_109968:422-1099(-)